MICNNFRHHLSKKNQNKGYKNGVDYKLHNRIAVKEWKYVSYQYRRDKYNKNIYAIIDLQNSSKQIVRVAKKAQNELTALILFTF